MPIAAKRLFFGALVLGITLTATGRVAADGVSAGQVQQIVQNNSSWLSQQIAGNLLYGLVSWLEIGLYLTWLVVTWIVIQLYSLIGTYIIPIWDFSNGSGFFNTATEASAWGVTCVPPAAANLLMSIVPMLLGVCAIAMFGGAALAAPKSLLDGREPFDSAAGLIWGVSLIVFYPLMYSVPIQLGNLLGRDVYQAGATAFSNSSGGQNGLFDALLTTSLFPNAVATASPSGTIVQSVNSSGLSVSSLVSQALGNSVSNLANTASNALTFGNNSVSQTAQLQTSFSNEMNEIFSGQGTIGTAITNAGQGIGLAIILFASRAIQIVLGIWGIIELVGILILKGGQTVAFIINFYLGWIACALYAFPGTRAVFWGWLKAHLGLCLWGLIWALLIFAMDIIVLAGNNLQGMSTNTSSGIMVMPGVPMAFAGVGLFLMPFILFGGIHKFKEVAALATGLTSTSQLAKSIGSSVRGSFNTGVAALVEGNFPGAVSSSAQKGSMGGALGRPMSNTTMAWSKGMQAVAAKASVALNAVPGVGPMAGAALKAGASAAGGAMQAAGAAAKYSNPFAGAAALAHRQQTPASNTGKSYDSRKTFKGGGPPITSRGNK